MSNFYSLVRQEINTEKSQNAITKSNIRSFVCLPSVRKEDIQKAFEKSFGYAPEKINILTFYKVVVNRKIRSRKKVAMKKVFLRLPKGKELNEIKESN